MIQILVNDGIEADGKLLLEGAGFTVDTNKIPQEDLMQRLPAYDAIIVRSATQVRRDLIDACPNLKIIARGGVGLDNIDVAYAKSKGIQIINTPAASSASVAELAMAHTLSLARFLQNGNRDMATGDFKKLKSAYAAGVQLRGKTFGIVGFGRIGQELARLALGMGMKVVASDPMIAETNLYLDIAGLTEAVAVTIKTTSFENVLKQADFVSLHVPNLGKPLVGAAELAMMKKGAFLINCARGGVVDESALLESLNAGHLGGAGLDTFVGEPKPRLELLNHPKISVSPHIGAATTQAQANIGKELGDKIIAYFATKKVVA
jgi:D-3-phosphoglycerate dehydrogenase / 2-oxoglutarate reductase